MSNKKLTLTGNDLKIKDIADFIFDKNITVEIASSARDKILKSEKYLKEGVSSGKIIYGINTGFGPMASHIINAKQIETLQKNLILSHAVGIGEPIRNDYVLASMLIRLNTLAKGYSGVSLEFIDFFKKIINYRIIPLVPEHGAVGTSGDLVQLAHVALAILGKGRAYFGGQVMPVPHIFKKLNLKPYKLKTKEGLALINGTSVMAGIGSLVWLEGYRALSISIRNGALSLELVGAYDDILDNNLHRLRPHYGQKIIAKQLAELLSSSKLLRNRDDLEGSDNMDDVHEISDEVQQVYSLRCIPQILGPILDSFLKTKKDIEIEINSTTDNPIIDFRNKKFLHGGNFHGDYIASSLDQLKAAIVKLTMLSERRVNFFLNSKINKIFPPFMNLKTPGLDLGLQGFQFVAASTTAHSQSLAYPHHLHSISTNGDNQDVVSMGCDAALMASKVLENAFVVLGIELITLGQGIDFKKNKNKFSSDSIHLYQKLRAIFPPVVEDREIGVQLGKVIEMIKQYEVVDF